jgi:multiple sugar transport system ATP-binding protein
MATLRLDEISLLLRSFELRLTLDVERTVALVGPSGAGKTTVLRIVAGLTRPRSGRVAVDDDVWFDGGRELPPEGRRVGLVFQDYALFPHMTVRQNVEYARRHTADDYLERFRIAHLANARPGALSGGERQRVALARAIVREPSVFLLDEPLSNLDAKLRASAREELEQFQKRVGTTAIYVTHDQVEAMAMGDRVVVMSQGLVRQIGTPADVYDEPADTFVATFLGSPPMNILPADDVLVGFRPEHFLPAAVADRTGTHSLYTFNIGHSEYLGAERILYGTIEGGPFHRQKAISRIPSTHAAGLEDGSTHTFSIAETNLKFFDRQSEKRTAARSLPA